jgi:hypothetical protein
MYHPTNKEQSIFYPADRDDLLVTLLFKSEEKFIAFVASMSHLKELFSRAQFSFSKHCETISSIQNVTNEFVLEVEYQKGNSTSPDQSRNNTEGSATSYNQEPGKQMQSLQNLNWIPLNYKVFRCHIAPVAHFPAYERDSANIIFADHLFHFYFDGDGKIPTEAQSSDFGDPPQLLVEFESLGPTEAYNGTVFQVVNVIIRFAFVKCAVDLLRTCPFREGYSELSDGVYKTFFYSPCAERTITYLGYKREMTIARWRHCLYVDSQDNIIR